MNRTFTTITFAIAVILLLLTPISLAAQGVDPADQLHDLAKQLNCPTCAGRNLADCPTDTCMQWKQEIKTQLESGKSDEQIIAYFRARFGDAVLQEPPREGTLLLVWVIPIVALGLLVLGVVLLLMRLQKRLVIAEIPRNANQATDNDEYMQQIEQEVNR